jgi:hypothetical protein
MSAIHTDPVLQAAPTEQPARREPVVDDRDAWRLAFERARDGAFAGWFQAPSDRAAAVTPDGSLSSSPSMPAASLFRSAADHGAGEAASPAPHVQAYTPAAQAWTNTGESLAIPQPQPMTEDRAGVASADALTAMLAAAWGRAVVTSDAPPLQEGPPPRLEIATVAGPGTRAAGPIPGEAPQESMETAPADARNRFAPAPPAGPREPVRTHVEQVDGGVRVWLGADAQALPAVDAMVAQLQQWFAGQGIRLLNLVCNGRSVWSAARESGAAATPAGAEPARPSSLFLSIPSQSDSAI